MSSLTGMTAKEQKELFEMLIDAGLTLEQVQQFLSLGREYRGLFSLAVGNLVSTVEAAGKHEFDKIETISMFGPEQWGLRFAGGSGSYPPVPWGDSFLNSMKDEFPKTLGREEYLHDTHILLYVPRPEDFANTYYTEISGCDYLVKLCCIVSGNVDVNFLDNSEYQLQEADFGWHLVTAFDSDAKCFHRSESVPKRYNGLSPAASIIAVLAARTLKYPLTPDFFSRESSFFGLGGKTLYVNLQSGLISIEKKRPASPVFGIVRRWRPTLRLP